MPKYEVYEIGKDGPVEVFEGDDANLNNNPAIIYKKDAQGAMQAVQQIALKPGWTIRIRNY